jgi:hypothetical protein
LLPVCTEAIPARRLEPVARHSSDFVETTGLRPLALRVLETPLTFGV